jgi:acetyl-CoA C-acetyltransferase
MARVQDGRGAVDDTRRVAGMVDVRDVEVGILLVDELAERGDTIGDDPTLMLNAPVPSARKILKRAGMTLDDIDLFEINEAFAVVSEKFMRDLDLDRDKVNVNGGAMALGHPIGATGAILIGTVLDELERQDKQVGLVTMCAGGGMAPAIIIERV